MLRLPGLVGCPLICRSSHGPHFENLAAVKMHAPSGSWRLGVHFAASILQCVVDFLNHQVGNGDRNLVLVPRSYPDDLCATVEGNRFGLSDRKQQDPMELKTSVRLATNRTHHNQEATRGVKPKSRRMTDSCRRWVSRKGGWRREASGCKLSRARRGGSRRIARGWSRRRRHRP